MHIRNSILPAVLLLAACSEMPQPEETPVPVRIEVAKRTEFAPAITLLGVVRPAQTIPLVAIQDGTVSYPRRFAAGLQTGVHVERGETIAEVRNDNVVLAQTQARLDLEAASAELERAKRTFDAGVMSSAEFSAYRWRAERARETYAASTRGTARLRIVAPRSGMLIVARQTPNESVVTADTVLAEIASSGAPVIESSVAAAERAMLRPGLVAKFSDGSAANGTARISEVASVIDASGTARVVAGITGGTTPVPGSGVEMSVELERRTDVLTIPEEAIVAAGEGPAVFVVASGDTRWAMARVKRVPIQLGGRANGRVEVTAGLRDGDKVVVSGVDALSEDVLVTSAEEKK